MVIYIDRVDILGINSKTTINVGPSAYEENSRFINSNLFVSFYISKDNLSTTTHSNKHNK
jgi:hypothetical protein